MTTQENSPGISPIFETIRRSIKGEKARAEEEANKDGENIHLAIGDFVKLIPTDIALPKLIDVEKENISPKRHINIIQYDPSTNQLHGVLRTVRKTDSQSGNVGEILSPDQQTDRIIEDLVGKDWLKYGLLVLNAIENAIKNAQANKMFLSSSPIPQKH